MAHVIRSIASVLLGYLTIAVGATIFQSFLFGGITYWNSPWFDLIVGGGLTALSAVVGGYILAMIAPFRPMRHAVPLVLWLGFETTVIYLTDDTAGPLWFDIISGGSLIAGVLIGTFAYMILGPEATCHKENDVQHT